MVYVYTIKAKPERERESSRELRERRQDSTRPKKIRRGGGAPFPYIYYTTYNPIPDFMSPCAHVVCIPYIPSSLRKLPDTAHMGWLAQPS